MTTWLLPSWIKYPSPSNLRHLICGILLGFSFSITTTSIVLYYRAKKQRQTVSRFGPGPIKLRSNEIIDGVTGLIGNTPLIRINSLSNALGVEILGKAEFLNPGGSVKDRVALRIIDDAEHQGLLHPHTKSRIFEGTVGSTGISIATIARARGYEATIIMPDDVAHEKVNTLRCLGAQIERVRPVSIVDTKHYVNLARQYAGNFSLSELDTQNNHHTLKISHSLPITSTHDITANSPSSDEKTLPEPRGFFADQFENQSNFYAHFEGTGPEIWRQTNGGVDAFVTGAGTGGTIAGIGQFLKSMSKEIAIVLADPEGSGLYNKAKYGVLFDRKEAEGTKRRHQVDTVVEGIGINRLTRNIELALPIIDDAFRTTDAEAVSMSRYLVQNDGLFVGSSSACSLVACVKLVHKMGWKEGQNVVTILCDSGNRHYSKFWNDEYLHDVGIPINVQIVEDLLTQSPCLYNVLQNQT